MTSDTAHFTVPLLDWYETNARSLPWRNTKDPYQIWLSEVILQQTRVAQGLPFYQRFVSAFPTVGDLAAASEEAVLKLWQGLGYYSRARNMHATARLIQNECGGVFPNTYAELITLKGIGPYTAAAIASFAFKEVRAVVDGNVYRVLSRLFGISIPINSTEGKKYFQALADTLIDTKAPDSYNQAIMEFGATVCTPKRPNCAQCIFNSRCEANRTSKVATLPVKLNKATITKRYLHYLCIEDAQQNIQLRRRPEGGIWAGLYEFPSIEAYSPGLLEDSEILDFVGQSGRIRCLSDNPIIHKLSHQHLEVWAYKVEVDHILALQTPRAKAQQFPVSALMERLLQQFKI